MFAALPSSISATPAMMQGAGMFGAGKPKMDWAGLLQGAIGGYMAGRGLPGGNSILALANQRKQAADQQAQYGQRREDEFQDFIRKQGWLAANKAPEVPDIIERINALNSIKDGLGNTYAENYAKSGGSPFGALFTDPATGQKYMMGGGGMPAIGSVMDDPRKQGGPMPSASGGFPGPY